MVEEIKAFFRFIFLREKRQTIEQREEPPTKGFVHSTKEMKTTVDAYGNYVDRRTQILFPCEESKAQVLASNADIVHLTSRDIDGEVLGGSGLEVIYGNARFIITSAANVIVVSLESETPTARTNLTGFKKRMGA